MRRYAVLENDDRGATAIEYGLIVGLIALGLVGSLVASKTSLSGALSRNATAMATATTTSPSTEETPANRLAMWSARTLVSKDVSTANGFTTTTFRYLDGSIVGYTQKADLSFQSIQISDPVSQTVASTYFNNGILEHYLVTTFASDMATPLSRQYAYVRYGQVSAEGTVIQMVNQSNYQDGSFRTTTTTAADDRFQSIVQTGRSDLAAFSQIAR